MAVNSSNAAKMARFLAIMQIITGVLLIGFGIADRLVKGRGFYTYYDWTGYIYFGVWIGIWVSRSSLHQHKNIISLTTVLEGKTYKLVNMLRFCSKLLHYVYH